MQNWAESGNEQIRHFSGTIIYRNEFNLPDVHKNAYLTFENMYETAAVSINGKSLNREIWCKPYRIEIAPYLQKGTNTIEVRVTNSWKNKILEQEKKPENERTISYVFNRSKPELSPSGTWGKIEIIALVPYEH